jgi:hypothetical protein
MRPSRVALTLCLGLLATGLTACSVSYGSSHEIDHKKVEDYLRTGLGKPPKSVACPSGVKEKKGGTFSCTLVLGNGKHATATIHMTDDKGTIHAGSSDIHVKD